MRSWWAYRRTAVRRRVLVNLRSGTAFSGVLWAQRGPLLVLRGATVHAGADATPVDGEIVVERSEVDYIQLLAG